MFQEIKQRRFISFTPSDPDQLSGQIELTVSAHAPREWVAQELQALASMILAEREQEG